MEQFSLQYWADFLGWQSFYLKSILAFVISLLLTFGAIPKIIRISYRKKLMVEPGGRGSHKKTTPNLGGVAIYYAVAISSSIFAYELFERYQFLYAGLVILFFIGLMDDILVVAPRKKLYAQIVATAMISMLSDVRIKSFFGLFGIEELPYALSILFTIFVFVIIINSYNLIDGIDGLAGGVAIVASATFAFVFWRLYDFSTAILCMAILGSTLGFLYYNLSNKNKIFMGDTGSMLFGFLLSFLAIKFINLCSEGYVNFKTSPVIAIGILIVPIIDTISVILIRISKKKSPLKADKNHIHHQFLKLGFNHIQTSLIIVSFNLIMIVLLYLLRTQNIHLLGVLVLVLGLTFALTPYTILKLKSKHV